MLRSCCLISSLQRHRQLDCDGIKPPLMATYRRCRYSRECVVRRDAIYRIPARYALCLDRFQFDRRYTIDKSQLLKRLDNAWEAFQASYAGLSDAEIMEAGVTGDWS